MNRICVFCGSSPGARPAYAEAAKELGRTLVKRGTGLVYGGGSVGLMGILAQSVLEVVAGLPALSRGCLLKGNLPSTG